MPKVQVHKKSGIRPVKAEIYLGGKVAASGILWTRDDVVEAEPEEWEVFAVTLRPLPGLKRTLRLKYKGGYVETVNMLGCSVEILNAKKVEDSEGGEE